MAKKYQAIETKVKPITYVIIGLIVVLLVVLLLVLKPTAKENFYNSYLGRSTEENFEKKLPKNNNFILLDNLNDSWLGIKKGMYSIGKSDKQLSIIFIGNPNNEVSVSAISNVYARLYGSTKTEPVINPSDLYTNLENKVKLYYFGLPNNKEAKTLESLNNHYEDEEIYFASYPIVLVLYNNEVVDYIVLNEGDNMALVMFNFYNDILSDEKLANFIN